MQIQSYSLQSITEELQPSPQESEMRSIQTLAPLNVAKSRSVFPPSPLSDYPPSPSITISLDSGEFDHSPLSSSIESSPVRGEQTRQRQNDTMRKQLSVMDQSRADMLRRTASAQEAQSTKSNPMHRSRSEGGAQGPSERLRPTATSQSVPEIYSDKAETTRTGWEAFYDLSDDFVESVGATMASLQREIHFLITSEENFVQGAKTFLQVFGTLGETLPAGKEEFQRNAFDAVEYVIDLNDKILLKALKEEQSINGPLLTFPATAVKEWLYSVKEPLINHAESYQRANSIYRKNRDTNQRFKDFIHHGSMQSVDKVRSDFSHLFESTRTRYPQYSLQLERIKKYTARVNPEDPLVGEIGECIEILNAIMKLYNETHGRIESMVTMANLETSIRYKSANDAVSLGLKDGAHQLVYQGKVSFKKSDVDTLEENMDLVLLDHYIIFANIKPDGTYLVVQRPIHLELLAIESTTDEPMFRSTVVQLANKMSRSKSETAQRTNSSSGSQRHQESSVSTSGSVSGTPASRNSSISGENYFHRRSLAEGADVVYPIKLRNLATDQKYYVCVGREIERTILVKTIQRAKEAYSTKARELKFNPLELRVIDTGTFKYPAPIKMSVPSKGNAVDKAVEEYKSTGVMQRTKTTGNLQCALEIVFNGIKLLFVGLDDDVYGTQMQPPGVQLLWTQVATLRNVSKLEAVPSMNWLFVLSEKTLEAYKLNEIIISVLQAGGSRQTELDKTPAITIANTVDCFKAGMLDDKPYVFHSSFTAKSTIKVLSITGAEAPKKSSRFSFSKSNKTIGGGHFKEIDVLFTPTQNRSIEFFNKTFCIMTEKSIEILSLAQLMPQSIPAIGSVAPVARRQGFHEDHADHLKKLIGEAKPIYMAKFHPNPSQGGANPSVLVYTKFALICDAHGDLLSAVVIKYQVPKITAARLWYPFLITFSRRVIEVYRVTPSASGERIGELVQVITGRNITCLGLGNNSSPSSQGASYESGLLGREQLPWAIVAMAHPELAQEQMLMELVLSGEIKNKPAENSLTRATAPSNLA